MSKFYDINQFEYPPSPTSSDEEYFGSGWSVRKQGDKFYFSYISGQLQGHSDEVEILEDDFYCIKCSSMSFDEICRKLDVH
ncbi:hypothetical protein [Photobacterium sp. 1_MG-2023]|uniref:hypothetical protein n=1 Tax=Photobacterium sp. 1_MG-2023 TaxID=3062646 RepID=UPI0026E38AAC|nr:hypothetical protein [Photobacterium sp. 1_MG-2023]MDO6708835.1 hypothetical protein [Photobacterium sp. 1_MG-2023]